MYRRKPLSKARDIDIDGNLASWPSACSARARALVSAIVLCLCVAPVWAQQGEQKKPEQSDEQKMRGLDEQVQEIKTDVLDISQELSRLEEKLLYPSGTEVAIFVALKHGDTMRLDAVRLRIDGKPATDYIYSFKELEALRKGGVQRIYVSNVATGEHKLDVIVEGKVKGGADFSRTKQLTFRKEAKPKLVELMLGGPDSGDPPIALVER